MKDQTTNEHALFLPSLSTVFIVIVLVTTMSQAQSGGIFRITQSAIGSNGHIAGGGIFALQSTSGQPLAGGPMTGPPFRITSGFWNPVLLPPTAAEVSLSGRVFAENEQGLLNAVVTATLFNGHVYSARTNNFGYFEINGLRAGETPIVTVTSKRYAFEPQVITLIDSVSDVIFTPLQ
jgi:hypothetical protein